MTKPLTDFSDRLSPIVVKELRQGLRTKTFVSMFITLQALMILIVGTSLLAASQGSGTGFGSGLFWTLTAIPLLFVLPMRGLGTVGNEIKLQTLDLLTLTRISPRRIILGKWIAIVAQTSLFVCAILPYVVLRYFMGGVNLADELLILALLLVISALLTAVTVGFSPYLNLVTRILFWIAVIVFMQVLLPFLLFVSMASAASFPFNPLTSAWLWVGLPVYSGLLIALMFETGASRIAPDAEKRSGGKRMITILFLVAAAGVTAINVQAGLIAVLLAYGVGIIVVAAALCEPMRPNPGLYRPIDRFGFAGRMLGRLLYSGWPSGIHFAIGFFLASSLLFYFAGIFDHAAATVGLLASIAAVVAPAAVIQLFFRKFKRPLVLFYSFQVFCLVATVLVTSIDSIMKSDLSTAAAVLPTCGILLAVFDEVKDLQIGFAIWYSILILGSVVPLLMASIPAWRQIFALESVASEAKTNPPSHAGLA